MWPSVIPVSPTVATTVSSAGASSCESSCAAAGPPTTSAAPSAGAIRRCNMVVILYPVRRAARWSAALTLFRRPLTSPWYQGAAHTLAPVLGRTGKRGKRLPSQKPKHRNGRDMLGIGTVARKIFGTPNDRKVKATRPLVAKINALEPDFEALSDAGLIEKTEEFRKRVAGGESLDALLPEAFANCREAARRALGLRAFDVQLMGGIFRHQGNISEMKTGEGKTLVATLPAYLNALSGRGVHIVTVNDYLAKRDADWMGKVYGALGLTTGTVYPQQPEAEKKEAYQADITYATNNELGFYYLRDNMKSSLEEMSQRGHNFAIVDEVDSILIDEARTPLIISGPAQDRSELYVAVDKLIPELSEDHYSIDEKTRNVTFTDEGNEFLERLLHEGELLPEGQSLYDPESTTVVHHVNQGLRAHKLFQKDK